jgi:translation initiation factor 1 (eIF-1/SUI1)
MEDGYGLRIMQRQRELHLARIIISKEIRGKYKKISTVITGIEENPESISSELKTKLGTGGPSLSSSFFCRTYMF